MAEKVVKVSAIQQRRDTVANWTAKNPILLDGEQITVILRMVVHVIKQDMVINDITNCLLMGLKVVNRVQQ